MPTRRSPVKRNRDVVAPILEAETPLPVYRLPVVAAAFAAGLLCTTRPVREVMCGVLRATLVLAKPALVVGGLLKLREMADHPSSLSVTHKAQPPPS